MQNPKQPILTPAQLALHDALSARDSRLGNMYYGALVALTIEGNPERFSQCAQSLRELVRHLTYVQETENLGTKAKQLCEKGAKCQKSNRGNLETEIFKVMAAELDAFSAWINESRPSIKKQAKKILDDLDPMFTSLPNDIIRDQVDAWLELRRYFEILRWRPHERPMAH